MRAADRGPKRQDPGAELPEPSGSRESTATPESGRSEALAEIFRNHNAALVRFLALRTGSTEDAKELVQEAYAKVLALDRPGAISLQAGFLWRIAVNLASDRRRQRASLQRFMSAARASSTEEAGDFSAESTCEARERLQIVERAIDELPPRCAEAFVLHVLQGLTFDEVGRRMGISWRMAIKHVSRALEYLQSCLDAADVTRSRR